MRIVGMGMGHGMRLELDLLRGVGSGRRGNMVRHVGKERSWEGKAGDYDTSGDTTVKGHGKEVSYTVI